MDRLNVLVLALGLMLSPPAAAGEAAPAAEDPALEARVMQLAEELRCLVCQNQTIADSQAGLAIDLRNQIRSQLSQGRSESQVREYMVQRYGDFVLYRPPLKATTMLLWFGPFLLIIAGVGVLGVVLARRGAGEVRSELSQEESRRAATLLGEGERT